MLKLISKEGGYIMSWLWTLIVGAVIGAIAVQSPAKEIRWAVSRISLLD